MSARLNLAPLAIRRMMLPAELLLLAALIAMFVVRGLIPAWTKLQTDFPNYYITARLLREHYAMGRIYDWIWFQRIKDHWSIPQELVGFLGLTPFSALPVYPLTWLDALSAKRVWLVENFALLAAMLIGMRRMTSLSMRHLMLIAFLAIIPLRNQFLYGQMHLLVVALILLAFWLDSRDRWLSCGMALGVAAALKIYPVFFIFYFLRKQQWKPALALAGSAASIFGACSPIFGAQAMRVFLIDQFPRMLRGEATDPFSLSAPSVSSLFHRLFLAHPLANPQPLIPSPLFYSLSYPLWQLCVFGMVLFAVGPRTADLRRRGLEWAAWACLLLTLSTEPATYHRVLLIVVVALALPAIDGLGRKAALFACYFCACNVYPSISPERPLLALALDFAPYWGLLGMLAVLVTVLRSERIESPTPIATRQTQLLWAGAAMSVWTVVAATTYLHIRAIANSDFVKDGSAGVYARFTPHLAGAHLLSVAMRRPGYRVEDESGQEYRTATAGMDDDQLAIASNAGSDRIWVEAVSGGRSSVIEVPLRADAIALTALAAIPDAESPALAPDAKTLVFLRETKGRSRAWMVRLDEQGRIVSEPVPLTAEEMDVRSAEFTSQDEVLISTAEDETPRFFRTHETQTPFRLIALTTPVSSSPQPIVRQQQSGGSWRVFASRPGGDASEQLTFGDCNAYDPLWLDRTTLVYISDCGRGNGLGALARLDGVFVPNETGKAVAQNARGGPSEETKQ